MTRSYRAAAIAMTFATWVEAELLARQARAVAPARDQVVVSGDLPDVPHIEPHLALDPKNPTHLLVTSIMFRREDAEGLCTSSVSFDAGVTWRRSRLLKSEPRIPGGDPWVAFDRDGTAYLSCLHAARSPAGTPSSRVGVYRSEDGGITWSGPVFIPGMPAEKLASQRSCPRLPGNTLRRTDVTTRDIARRWTEGGDYHGWSQLRTDDFTRCGPTAVPVPFNCGLRRSRRIRIRQSARRQNRTRKKRVLRARLASRRFYDRAQPHVQ
jgi:hypothetical protein